jgi:signal transduction histidine kinase
MTVTEGPHATNPRGRTIIGILVLAAVYVVAARAGLALDAVSGIATLVWAPTGLAIAALLLFGMPLWPGVFLGAVVANFTVGAPLVRFGIGIGNTLEAVTAAYALGRVADFTPRLDRLRSVVAFVLVCIGATLISATVGVASMRAGGYIAAATVVDTWQAWWLGDLLGALVVSPVVLVWASSWPRRVDGRVALEAAGLLAATLTVGLLIFFTQRAGTAAQPYLLFPVLIWAAVRFGPHGAVSATFVASVIAVSGTVLELGPFNEPVLHERLAALQAFMGIVAATFLVLAAASAESRAAKAEAERARADAEDANRAKADFLAVMSHELRTPLNAIAGYVDLLASGAHGELTTPQKDSLERVYRNYQHLHMLIKDLLGFAQVEAGRLTLAPRPILVAEIFDAVEPLIQPELRRKQLVYAREGHEASLTVVADPERLRQILANMLSNAVKYTDAGGRVVIGAGSGDPGRVRIWVTDSGIGIPADQIPRVFEPFFQVERGTTRRYPGIGLGLTIARDLARAMKGDIVLESTPGSGTTITVVLPSA